MSSLTVLNLEERGFVQAPDGSWSKPGKPCPQVNDTPPPKCENGSKRKKKQQQPSGLALQFEALWSVLAGKALPLAREHRFHPKRKWRFDYAHLGAMVAIEIDGGVFTQGRHVRAQGFVNDCTKLNHATECGWHIFRLASGMVNGAAVEQIIKTILERLTPTPT